LILLAQEIDIIRSKVKSTRELTVRLNDIVSTSKTFFDFSGPFLLTGRNNYDDDIPMVEMSTAGKPHIVIYGCYMCLFSQRKPNDSEIERDRIRYLLNRDIEHIVVLSQIWDQNDVPDFLRERIIIPKHSSLFAKSKILGRLYYNFLLLKISYDMYRKGLRPIIFFYGQDLIFAGSLIRLILKFPYICYLGDSYLGVEPTSIGVVNFNVRLLRAMEWFTRKADRIVLFNSVEKRGLVEKGFNEGRIEVIPFSKNNEYNMNQAIEDGMLHSLKGKFIVSYHGRMEYKPSYVGAMNIINRIAPKLFDAAPNDVVFLIVGNKFEDVKKPKNVITVNFIPEKEKLMYILSLSSLYVVPIDTGTGIKGKLLDALSLGIPAIVTPHTMSQMVSNDSPLIVSEVDKMSDAIISVLNMSKNEYTSLKNRTLLYFSNNYTEKVYERYISIFQELW